MLVRPGSARFSSLGVTLIELMVVVSIAAILAGVGLPSFKNFIAGQRVKTAAGEFSMAAIQARSEAIKRNAEVGVFAATGGWLNGWTTKVGTTTLASQESYTGLTMGSPVTEVVYLGTGRLKEQTLVSKVQFSSADTNSVRCVSFDLSGLPKTRSGACS